MTPARQSIVDEELAKMIASDFQPFSIVEDKGFRSFPALNPMMQSSLGLFNAHIDALDQEEWEALQETCTVLEPFEQVTVEISSESYVTSSKMLLLCRGLQKITAYNQTQVTKRKVTELVTALSTSMDRKSHRMEYNTVLSESTVLDPRFKRLAFIDNCAVDEALQSNSSSSSVRPQQPASSTTRRPRGSKGTRSGATNVCCLEAL
ncbi:Zinc finger BED domain containing protein 1 [Dissostichus eleginoides]|uniref:Zinc finger BED domain containing protein 1 n=1 Tax=Dissostichus eleginoides TaxID=100907 RepID=A0AAD9CSL9_DISEL|nr:Zinc finger BED domain containing protein 1 [Dissostichus eleginoides]